MFPPPPPRGWLHLHEELEREGDDDEAPAPGPVFGEPVLFAWLAAFELMEDEDEDVRDVAAGAAAAAAGVAADTQTEEVLRRSFAVVSQRMARWPPYERYLIRVAAGAPVRAETLRDVVAGLISSGDCSTEADNHHAEDCYESACGGGASRGWVYDVAAHVALDAALTSAEEAAAALGGELEGGGGGGEASSKWAGGATNHESAFLPVCRVFLTTWALAPTCAPLSMATATRVDALDDALTTRVDLGPMARAMWAAAREALTRATGASSAAVVAAAEEEEEERKKKEDGVDDASCDGDAFTNLDPCFLLQ